MTNAYDKLMACLKSVKRSVDFRPEVGLVLGSGLGGFADEIDIRAILDFSDIEGFPRAAAPGHKGRFVFGYAGGLPVVVAQGRVHYYEGYAMSDVVLPVRLMGMLGVKKLILTNAAGGVNPGFAPGDLMIISDHIAASVPNPLIGVNADALGPRFPDMSEVYSKRLSELIKDAGYELHIPLKEGVYIQFTGPSYETPAEIRMCRVLGGDAIGMSTACEAIAARHMGLEVCGISCITNPAAGQTADKLSHEDVQKTAGRVSEQFQALLTCLLDKIHKLPDE